MPETPFADAYEAFLASGARSFSLPGHHRALADPLLALDAAYVPEVEDSARSSGALQRAEALAASAWGASFCRFSVAGSTMANQALLLGAGRPGERIAIARTAHASAFNGLVLSGLVPVWVRPDVADVARALASGVCAVWLVEPSYTGMLSDVAAIAALTREAGVPLLVDQAWGAHFGFSPAVPPNALQLGADAMVTSAHKTLAAFTQGALLLARGELLDVARLDAAFEALHTTSPSAAILASLDRARAFAVEEGPQRGARTASLVAAARNELADVAVRTDDPLKLVLDLARVGADGFAVERELRGEPIVVEFADRDTIIPIVTLADDQARVDALVLSLRAAIDRHRGEPRAAIAWRVEPQVVRSPREAFFAAAETTSDPAGRVSAETAAPYPPGIAVVAPGELITAELLEALREEAAKGTRIAFASDPTLATMRVVR